MEMSVGDDGPSCSASNYLAEAGFEDNVSQKHFLYLLYSATQKKIYSGCFFRYECDMILTKTEKKGCIPKLESLGID